VDLQVIERINLSMPENKKFQPIPILCLCCALLAGAACTRWIPYDWFLNVLGYSISVSLILGVLLTLNTENERKPPIPIALVLEALWLSSRNAEIKLGPTLWAFLGASSFVVGILVSALLL